MTVKNWAQVFISLLLLVSISSCNNEGCEDEIDIENKTEISIQRLEDEFFNMTTAQDVLLFMNNNPNIAEAFFQRSQYPHDSIVINRLLKLVKNPYLDTVRQEVNTEFGDLQEIEMSFTDALNRIKHFYPEFKIPKIKTMISGLADGGDLVITPDVIVIGLDWFLGNNASYKPNNVPDYILDRMQKAYIVPTTILFLSNAFNETDLEDKTMLAEMIYYGKAYEFTSKILPCIQDSILLGYGSKALAGVNFNQEKIWGHFVNEELLYENNQFVKVKYMNERPSVAEIGDECPGRIGRWLGWEILKAYMENSDEDFISIMKNKDAKSIFTQSKYRPNPH